MRGLPLPDGGAERAEATAEAVLKHETPVPGVSLLGNAILRQSKLMIFVTYLVTFRDLTLTPTRT